MQPTGTAGAVARGLSLLEATQLKTVRTVVAILRSEPGGAEVQAADTGAGHRRRPTAPVVADVTQCPKAFIVSCVAVARGRGRSACEGRFFLSQGFFLPIFGGNATEDRTHGGSCTAEGASCSGSSSGGHRRLTPSTTSCTRRRRRHTMYRILCYFRRRGSPGPRRAAREGCSLLCKDRWSHSESSFVSRRQRKELRAPSSSSPRPGWRRLARPVGSQFPNRPAKKLLRRTLRRPTVTVRAPGKFFRFNSSLKRSISLLRQGARCRSATS